MDQRTLKSSAERRRPIASPSPSRGGVRRAANVVRASNRISGPGGSRRADYTFGKELGRGSFGVVHGVQRKVDGAAFVCKEIGLKSMSAKMREESNQEVALLSKVSSGSEYIVQYVESFLQADVLHIVMEFCEHGDLDNYLRAQKGASMEEAAVWKFLLQICLGLSWLHENRIMHRDMKALNVFLTAADDARIGDLGVARVMGHSKDFARTLVGTPYYLSPEVCEEKPYDQKSDVWAFGCIVYEMCALRHPFAARNQAALILKIVQGQRDPVPEAYSPELRAVVDTCLQLEPGRRPASAAILASDAATSWSECAGVIPASRDERITDPEKRALSKRAKALGSRINKLYQEAVRGLDRDARGKFDDMYLLFRAKIATDFDSDDLREVETFICQELATENTFLIGKACEILGLEIECDHYAQQLKL